MVVPVETDPTFRAGDPEVLFEQQYFFNRSRRTYDLAPDGQRFLMVKEGAATPTEGGNLRAADHPRPKLVRRTPAPRPRPIDNWFEELTSRVPTN